MWNTSSSPSGNSSVAAFTSGTATGLTSFGLRSSAAAFDLKLASSEALTANRTLSFNVGDADRMLTIPATGTVALLGRAQTFTAANIFSVNGAASTPALTFSGSIMSGGSGATNLPHLLFQPSGTTTYTGYNTTGTVIGFNLSGSFGGYVLDYINGGNRAVYIDSNGFGVRDTNSANSTYFWYDGVQLNDTAKILWYPSSISGSADSGIVRVGVSALKVNNGGSGFGSLIASALTVNTGGVLKLGNAAVTGLTPAVVAGILTKSVTIQDLTGATITLYGS